MCEEFDLGIISESISFISGFGKHFPIQNNDGKEQHHKYFQNIAGKQLLSH